MSWTDNTVAMAAMRSMAPRTEVMQAITARRTEYLFQEYRDPGGVSANYVDGKYVGRLGLEGADGSSFAAGSSVRAEGTREVEGGGGVPGVARHISAVRGSTCA